MRGYVHKLEQEFHAPVFVTGDFNMPKDPRHAKRQEQAKKRAAQQAADAHASAAAKRGRGGKQAKALRTARASGAGGEAEAGGSGGGSGVDDDDDGEDELEMMYELLTVSDEGMYTLGNRVWNAG